MGNFVSGGPNEAVIKSGLGKPKVSIGRTTFRFWMIESVSRLTLELLTIPVISECAETKKGVRINVKSVAQVKVKSRVENSEGTIDKAKILIAAQHFLGGGAPGTGNIANEAQQKTAMVESLRESLEGYQRQIVAQLTVEELYTSRAELIAQIKEHVVGDLDVMGFELVSFTVQKIDDDDNYMDSLGKEKTAATKRSAAEGKAKNEAAQRKKVAEYKADALESQAISQKNSIIARNKEEELIAQSRCDLKLKQSAAGAEVNKARAKAAAAKLISAAQQRQRLIQEQALQEKADEEVKLEIASQIVQRTKKEMEGQALANLLEVENRAKMIQVNAEAEAERVRALGEAEAEAIKLKGEAEARALQVKAAALKKYGQAAVAQLIVEQLPTLAEKIARPLGNTDKIAFVSSDGSGPSAFTEDMARMLGHLPLMVEAITGYDLKASVQSVMAQTSTAKPVEATI